MMSYLHIWYLYIGSLSLASFQQYDLGDQRDTLLENADHVYANTCVMMVKDVLPHVKDALSCCTEGGMGNGKV
jgi:hypothetical protein